VKLRCLIVLACAQHDSVHRMLRLVKLVLLWLNKFSDVSARALYFNIIINVGRIY
jgi:hypothetical protein